MSVTKVVSMDGRLGIFMLSIWIIWVVIGFSTSDGNLTSCFYEVIIFPLIYALIYIRNLVTFSC
jgi:hypothetical protein